MTERVHLFTFLGALAACMIGVFWMVGPYLLALFLGGTLAMLAHPVQRWLLKEGIRPCPASATIVALLVLLVIAPLAGFSVLAVKQGVVIGQEMAELKEFSPRTITAAVSRWQVVRMVIGDADSVNSKLKGAIRSAGQLTGAAVLELGKNVPEYLLQLLLVLIAFYYFLRDGQRFMDWLFGLGALDLDVQKELAKSFRDTAISAVLAGLAAAVSQAALISIGFMILEIPGAFLAGGLTFLFAWIPLLGTAPASVAGMLYLYVQGSTTKLFLMAALGFAAAVVDNLVRPMVLKGRADMHPLVAFVAIIGGLQMFGVLGVFIGPIMAAMLLSLLRIWPAIERRFGIHSTAGR